MERKSMSKKKDWKHGKRGIQGRSSASMNHGMEKRRTHTFPKKEPDVVGNLRFQEHRHSWPFYQDQCFPNKFPTLGKHRPFFNTSQMGGGGCSETPLRHNQQTQGLLSVVVSAAADRTAQLIMMSTVFLTTCVPTQPGISRPGCSVACYSLFPRKPYPYPSPEILLLRTRAAFSFWSFIASEGVKGKPANTHSCDSLSSRKSRTQTTMHTKETPVLHCHSADCNYTASKHFVGQPKDHASFYFSPLSLAYTHICV